MSRLYLIWRGIQVWRSPPITLELGKAPTRVSNWSLFRQGSLSALTNPKGLLFFQRLPAAIHRAPAQSAGTVCGDCRHLCGH